MGQYRKAIAAFIVAGTGALATAGVDNAITVGEILVAVAAACAAAGAVFGVPNAPGEA